MGDHTYLNFDDEENEDYEDVHAENTTLREIYRGQKQTLVPVGICVYK